MERLAKAVLLAAKIREESYDKEKANEIQETAFRIGDWIDCSSFYTKSLHQSADEAAEAMGFDKRGTEPIYLLLRLAWNDALAWAELYEKGE